MVTNPRPTRAEATDVYNAILDGTDAVMLSEESAVGRYPVAAVRCLAAVAREAEAALVARPHAGEPEVKSAVGAAAVDLARSLHAAAIITPTSTGRTPRAIARHRPVQPIVALASDRGVLHALALVWGVIPCPVPKSLGLDEVVSRARALLRSEGVKRGRPFVVTLGHPPGRGLTNLVHVTDT
jgi:pyruvate kinase